MQHAFGIKAAIYLCAQSRASETDLLGLSGVDSGLSVRRDLPEAMSQVCKVEKGLLPTFPAWVVGCLVIVVSCMALLFCSTDFAVILGSQVPGKKNMKMIGNRHFSRPCCDRTRGNGLK